MLPLVGLEFKYSDKIKEIDVLWARQRVISNRIAAQEMGFGEVIQEGWHGLRKL